MHQVAFIIDAPNHHAEEWTCVEKGQETVATSIFIESRNSKTGRSRFS